MKANAKLAVAAGMDVGPMRIAGANLFGTRRENAAEVAISAMR